MAPPGHSPTVRMRPVGRRRHKTRHSARWLGIVPEPRQDYRAILKLNIGVFIAPINWTHIGRTISAPRAVVMSPRSITCLHPKLRRISVTLAFAPESLPLTNTSWSPFATRFGLTMTMLVIVFKVLTTLALGKARWICSPSESVLHTISDGGIPFEKSSGFEMSIRTLPAMFLSPATLSTLREAAPAVALTSTSPWLAASANGASFAFGCVLIHALNGGFPM